MRKLSAREKVLLVVLLILVAASGYVLGFYMPMNQRLEELDQQIADAQDTLLLDEMKVQRKAQLQRELLAALAQAEHPPVAMAPYDNVQAVMFMLNSILGQTEEYSLTFGTVAQESGSGSVVRRPISLRFRSPSYDAAQEVLQQLHDSDLRCMLDDVSISTDSSGQQVTVSAVLVFFEYQQSGASDSAGQS